MTKETGLRLVIPLLVHVFKDCKYVVPVICVKWEIRCVFRSLFFLAMCPDANDVPTVSYVPLEVTIRRKDERDNVSFVNDRG